MSGKSDVVDGGIVEGHCARALGPDNRQRHGDARLPTFGLQDLLDATQDERPRRTALTRRPSLQLAVHSVRDIDSRAHEAIVPYLWRGVTERGRLGNSARTPQ